MNLLPFHISLTWNCTGGGNHGNHVFRPVKLETIFRNGEVFLLLQVLIELTVDSGHLTEATNPRCSITRGCREEIVAYATTYCNAIDRFRSNRRQAFRDVDIKPIDIETEFKARHNAFTSNIAPHLLGRAQVH